MAREEAEEEAAGAEEAASEEAEAEAAGAEEASREEEEASAEDQAGAVMVAGALCMAQLDAALPRV